MRAQVSEKTTEHTKAERSILAAVNKVCVSVCVSVSVSVSVCVCVRLCVCVCLSLSLSLSLDLCASSIEPYPGR
jgi:hypothetical protein